MANEFLKEDYEKVECHLRELQYSTDFIKSIIDTDTRTLMNCIQQNTLTYVGKQTLKDKKTIINKVRNALFG